jgi:hypothetical protein
MGRACSTNVYEKKEEEEEKSEYRILMEKPEGKRPL